MLSGTSEVQGGAGCSLDSSGDVTGPTSHVHLRSDGPITYCFPQSPNLNVPLSVSMSGNLKAFHAATFTSHFTAIVFPLTFHISPPTVVRRAPASHFGAMRVEMLDQEGWTYHRHSFNATYEVYVDSLE